MRFRSIKLLKTNMHSVDPFGNKFVKCLEVNPENLPLDNLTVPTLIPTAYRLL